MSYRVSETDPVVTVEPSAIEVDLAVYLKAQGIATQAQWTTFVANMTAAQLLAFEKARLVREVTLVP